jgi:predicted transcriptional regulator
MTPNAIAEEFHYSRQAVSKHIPILTECGLVKQEKKVEKFTITSMPAK